MLRIHGIIPHPELYYHWQISKIITIFISIMMILIDAINTNYTKLHIYCNTLKIVDLILLLSIFILRVFIQKRLNIKKIFYTKEYKDKKLYIFIINFLSYGCIIRIILNCFNKILYKVHYENYNFINILDINKLNIRLIILLYYTCIILISISIYKLFYKEKYISVYNYNNKIIKEIKLFNMDNKTNKISKLDKFNYITNLNRNIFKEQNNYEIKNRIKNTQSKSAKTNFNNKEKIEVKDNKITIEQDKKSNRNITELKYETIPEYGIYITKSGQIFINGRQVNVFK